MRWATDLHLHSCLSPCAEDEMTPNNLVNMAWLKGLELIAVTDHNSARNLPACWEVAQARDVALLPGLEVTTREDVHCLCYFPTVEEALAFSAKIHPLLGDMPNVPRVFGNQLVLNAEDEQIAVEPMLLIQALSLTLAETVSLADAMGGLAVPAHINRGANGLLINLGILPEKAGFAALELSPNAPAPLCDLGDHKILYASDAHRLEDIAEPHFYLDLPEKSARAAFDFLLQRRDRMRA
ncbi:MAG: PHP domain-containing protein [Clostridia bacterium]